MWCSDGGVSLCSVILTGDTVMEKSLDKMCAGSTDSFFLLLLPLSWVGNL